MNINEIKLKLDNKEYDFLRDNEHLGDNICLLGLGGSYAYGLENENSDLDIRGIACNRPEEIIGFSTFDNFRNDETDTVVYGTTSFVKLLTDCNPNIIEILGLKEEQFITISPIGRKILDNKNLFLSQKVYNTFGGYALAQLRKLDAALAGNSEKQEVKEEHVLNSIKRYERSWDEHFKTLDEGDSFELFTDKSNKEGLESEIYANIHLTHYPVRDMHEAIKGMTDIINDYDKLTNRNIKATDKKMGKHMSHLVRLYKMGAEILRTGEINTYRENDREELLAIKNGKYLNEDGTCKPEFRELVNSLEADLEKALKETKLPKKPDYNKIQELMMEINNEILEKDIKEKSQDIRR